MKTIKKIDEQLFSIIKAEENRQANKLNMIPSENIAPLAVREAVGSVFANKYAEGTVGKRFYEGVKYADELEQLAKDRILKTFGLNSSNWAAIVQPLSGSAANLAVYVGLLNLGDSILSMYLPDGGHLSHGWSFDPDMDDTNNSSNKKDGHIYKGGSRKVSFVSQLYNVIQYKTNKQTEVFDYNELDRIIRRQRPKLVITGGTAYPREIKYQRVGKSAHEVGALYLADIAHEAGLIAAKVNKSPFRYADIVTFTTHKTFRGPRGAVILCRKEYEDTIAKAVFPGLQGGPHLNKIAGIAVAAKLAQTDEFKKNAQMTVENANHLANALRHHGFYPVSGGTDKHLVLLNLKKSKNIPINQAKKLARALDYAGLVCNYNTVPWETGTPLNPSGLRLGTPIVTIRGMKPKDMEWIAKLITDVNEYLAKYANTSYKESCKAFAQDSYLKIKAREVKKYLTRFPIPTH